MTVVDLDNIGVKVEDRQAAIDWLFKRYGPAGDEWDIDELTYVIFADDKKATYFIMRFS